MELRRELIERADFPQVRRGLDPEAVSKHLAEVAKAVEATKETQDKGSAANTGEHVRAIVEAAETAATQLEQTARADAERMRSSAKAEADSLLTNAKNEAESTLTSARSEAHTTLTSARNESENTLTSARSEAKSTLASARDEAESTISNAKSQAEKTVSSANASAQQTLSSAKAEAEKTVSTANASAHQTLTSAKAEAEKTVADANASADGTLSRAKVESERMVTAARKEAESTLSSARAEAASTRASSRAQAQAHMERAEQAVLRLLERSNVVEGDLGKLVADAKGSITALAESVRAGADKLRSDLDIPREERNSGRFVRSEQKPAPAKQADPAPPATPAPAASERTPSAPVAAGPGRLVSGNDREDPGGAARAVSAEARRRLRQPVLRRASRGLAGARARVRPRLRPVPSGGSARPWSRRPPRQPQPAADSTTVGLSGVRTPAVGPRLAAFNMARAGTSREEVAVHLKEKFGLEDSKEILDDVFDRANGGA